MKPAKCKYAAVDSVEEAVELLGRYGDEAKVLAGGQSLIPLMNLRLARPGVLVDINRVDRLNGIQRNGTVLRVGAIARHADLLRSEEVREAAPMIGEALRLVAHPGIRSRGTIGGSIAHADPAAELPIVFLALHGEVVVQGPKGERRVAAEDLFVSPFATSIAEDELITRVDFHRTGNGSAWAFHEVARRHGDFALVGTAVAMETDNAGQVTAARIALSGVGDRPQRAHEAEESLVGKKLDENAAAEAGRLAAEKLDPPSDIHASAKYRRKAAEALVERSLQTIANEGVR